MLLGVGGVPPAASASAFAELQFEVSLNERRP